MWTGNGAWLNRSSSSRIPDDPVPESLSILRWSLFNRERAWGPAESPLNAWYAYENANHAQLTKVTETNSGGMQRITRMQYPVDYGSGSGNMDATTIQFMKADSIHMHSQVIERWVAEKPSGGSETVISAELTPYWLFHSSSVRSYVPHERWVLAADAPISDFTPSSISSTLQKDSRYVKAETAYGYDIYGRVTGHWDAEGHFTTSTYGNANASGPTAQYEFKSGGVQLVTNVTYNSQGQISQIKEYGKERDFTYDAFERLESIKSHGGQTVTAFSYDFSRTATSGSSFDPSSPNSVTTVTHLTTSPARSTTSIQFLDGLGRPIQTQINDGSEWVVTHQEYDAMGRDSVQWRPYSHATSGSYDASFASNANADYSGATPFTKTVYTADPLDRPKTVTPPYEGSTVHTVSHVYGVSGTDTYVEITDESGNKTRTFTDGWGNTVQTVGGFGTSDAATTSFTYDALGNRTQVTDPRGLVTSYTMGTQGLLAEKTSPDAGTVKFKYDAEGNLRYTQDANQAAAGTVFFQTYDHAERPLTAGVGSATFSSLDPNASSPPTLETTTDNWVDVRFYDAKPDTTFPWSQFDTQIASASQSNLSGRVSAIASKSDGSWQLTLFSYNSDGQLTRRYIYTHKNGTTTVLAALDTEIEYVLDLQGVPLERQLSVGSSDFNHWFEYDDRALIEKVFASTSSTKPSTPVATYAYEHTGQVESLTYKGSSLLPYTYHVRGWLHEIGDPSTTSHPFAARYAYEPNGNVDSAEFYNGGASNTNAAFYRHHRWTFSYDALNRMKEGDYWFYTGTTPYNAAYHDIKGITYDKSGNLKTLRRYDDAVQLVDQLYNYNYPSTSNRLSSVNDLSGSTPEPWDIEGGSFTYDANGNMLTAPAPYSLTTVSYDHRNLPTSLTSGGSVTKHRYNQDGLRIMKEEGSADPVYYVVDGQVILGVFTVNSSDQVTASEFNVTAGDRVIGRETGTGDVRLYFADMLGSARVVVDDTGVIQESVDYDPMGVRLAGRTTGSDTTRTAFTGKEYDEASQLVYFGARFYLPALRRLGEWRHADG